MSKVFVSYRRQDTGTAARRLAADFATRYGENNVFVDTDSIRVGSDWPKVIDAALASADVIVVVIGPKWIFTHDQDGRRRIDNDTDWVRSEVVHGLRNNKTVVPLLVQGAQQLKESSLPEALKGLCKLQSYAISEQYWKRDVRDLFAQLENSGSVNSQFPEKLVLPAKRDATVPMTDEAAIAGIDASAGWSLVHRQRTYDDISVQAREITKTYVFESFEDCIHFMGTAARHIAFTDHHPRWENIWINLVVSLTSFDIGGKLTYKDVRLAKYLDELFVAYKKKSEA